ncbi:MAG TPA: DUF4383 domain-containing protein [Mycobacterium sp.]|nr:DUF4383 domain-containing protein [Mycobacterium sp.]
MAVQSAALLVAVAFLVVGLLGFVPGVTTHYEQLEWAGRSGAKLFNVIAVSGVHNAVHLVFGIVGLVLSRTYAAARAYLVGGGLAYLALWVGGILVDHIRANVGPASGVDNWLHFGLGAAMVVLGLTLGGQRDPTKRRRKSRT